MIDVGPWTSQKCASEICMFLSVILNKQTAGARMPYREVHFLPLSNLYDLMVCGYA